MVEIIQYSVRWRNILGWFPKGKYKAISIVFLYVFEEVDFNSKMNRGLTVLPLRIQASHFHKLMFQRFEYGRRAKSETQH
jgi:hypothetical protein